MNLLVCYRRLNLVFTLVILFIGSFTYSQPKYQKCNCAHSIYGDDTKADTTFYLANGKAISLCGFRDTDIEKAKGIVYFSEFVLSVCGESEIIKFWGAVLVCQLKVAKDTLVVETLHNLATGKNMAFEWRVWTIERIYFVNGEAVIDFKVNRKIPKYNTYQIEASLKEYEQMKREVSDKNMEIADKLFMSAISGSKKARMYLLSFKDSFGGLSGVYAEWYNDVRRMLKLWDTNIPSEDFF